jgi:3-hydroxyisobutyrate dehydrogenase-like beta-hydroxyacid dehydrogenase
VKKERKQANTMQEVGLVGIGLVGAALAGNLLKSGYRVYGYDIDSSRRELFGEMGGTTMESAAAVAARCTVALLSLPDTATVLNAVEGAQGLLQASRIPRIIIDTTTGDPEQTMALAGRLQSRGVGFLDATISGSSEQIRDREGVFLIGGKRTDHDACEPIFRTLAKKYFYIGSSGSGSKTKLASNLILGLNRLALAEGLIFAEKLGLDLHRFLEVIRHTPAYSAAIEVKGEKMISGDFSPQSKISQHRKDLRIILEYGRKLRQPLPLSESHYNILGSAEENGLGNADTCAVIEQLRLFARGEPSE